MCFEFVKCSNVFQYEAKLLCRSTQIPGKIPRKSINLCKYFTRCRHTQLFQSLHTLTYINFPIIYPNHTMSFNQTFSWPKKQKQVYITSTHTHTHNDKHTHTHTFHKALWRMGRDQMNIGQRAPLCRQYKSSLTAFRLCMCICVSVRKRMISWGRSHPDTKPPNSAGGYSFHLLTFNLILLGNRDPVEFVEDTHPPLEKWYNHYNQKSITSIFI